jgi:hypothetical protein
VAGRRQRYYVRVGAPTHALLEPSHEGRISSMNPTSRLQFERPRVERWQGTIAALRLADDIAGAEPGFRLLPFTPAVSSLATGGLLVGLQGVHLGIITRGIARELRRKSL